MLKSLIDFPASKPAPYQSIISFSNLFSSIFLTYNKIAEYFPPKSMLFDFSGCRWGTRYELRNVLAVNVLLKHELLRCDKLQKGKRESKENSAWLMAKLPLIAFSSSNKFIPARFKIRFDTALLSFSRSLVVFVMQSAFRSEMSPSHKTKRPLISSRCGKGLCWRVSV